VINQHEKDEVRKKAILEQIYALLSKVSLVKVDLKSKELFGTHYNQLKTFIYNL